MRSQKLTYLLFRIKESFAVARLVVNGLVVNGFDAQKSQLLHKGFAHRDHIALPAPLVAVFRLVVLRSMAVEDQYLGHFLHRLSLRWRWILHLNYWGTRCFFFLIPRHETEKARSHHSHHDQRYNNK